MLKKNIITLITVLVLLISFSMSAYATNDDDFFDVFDITKSDIKELTTSSSNSDINDYKVFKFKKGFDKVKFSTFASSKNVSGQGEEGVSVGVLVYKMINNDIKISFDSVKSLGASGLYSETIPFDNIGINNVLIAVKKGDYYKYRVFEITRKKEETKDRLENIQINFLPKEEPKEKESGGLVEQLIERFTTFDFLKSTR